MQWVIGLGIHKKYLHVKYINNKNPLLLEVLYLY